MHRLVLRALAVVGLALAAVTLTGCGPDDTEASDDAGDVAAEKRSGRVCGAMPTEALQKLAGRTTGFAESGDLTAVRGGNATCRLKDEDGGTEYGGILVSEDRLGQPAEQVAKLVEENGDVFCEGSDTKREDLGEDGYFCQEPAQLVAELPVEGGRVYRLIATDNPRVDDVTPGDVEAWFAAIDERVVAAQRAG